MKRISVLVLFFLLSACATPETPPVPERESEEISFQNPAVVALLEEAERQHAQGRLDHAASALERALRISPHDPVLRLRLGWLRLEQNDPFQAKALARMAFVHAGEQRPGLRADAWDLIAAAERAIGDQVEATLAEQEAARLRRQ